MQMAMTRGFGEEKEEESLPVQRRKCKTQSFGPNPSLSQLKPNLS